MLNKWHTLLYIVKLYIFVIFLAFVHSVSPFEMCQLALRSYVQTTL